MEKVILDENLDFGEKPLKKALRTRKERKREKVFLQQKDKKIVAVEGKAMALQVGEEEDEVEIFKKLQFALRGEGTKRQKQEKEEATIFDLLTGLYSRNYIDTILEQQYCLFKRHFQRFGLVVISIDKFKEIKENFGALKGEEVLKFVAAVLQRSIRNSDSLARFEEDKFIIICPIAELEGVAKLSERIVGLIHYSVLALTERLTKTVKVSVSIGCAVVDYKDKAVLGVITRAREALALARREGGNSYSRG